MRSEERTHEDEQVQEAASEHVQMTQQRASFLLASESAAAARQIRTIEYRESTLSDLVSPYPSSYRDLVILLLRSPLKKLPYRGLIPVPGNPYRKLFGSPYGNTLISCESRENHWCQPSKIDALIEWS